MPKDKKRGRMFVRVCVRMFEPIQNQREYLIREKRKKERKKSRKFELFECPCE